MGLAIALSVTGWFGVQKGFLAEGLRNAVGGALPLWLCAVVGGVAITLLVVQGFRMLRWIAYVAVPALFLLATGDVVYLIVRHGALAYLWDAAPGPSMSIVQGVTLVVGTMIVGAVIAPDYSRYDRAVRDVILQSVVGIAFGELLVGFVGFILARAIRTSDIPTTMTSINGLLGALIVMLSVVDVNNAS